MSNNPVNHNARSLSLILKIFCVLPLVTGLVDMLGGTWILALAGVGMPADVAADPILNNQIAFWGAVWFGYGIALWWTSNAVSARAATLKILLGTLFLSGLGRAFSVILYGWAGTPLTVAMFVEVAGSVGLFVWLATVLRADERRVASGHGEAMAVVPVTR